MLFTGKTVSLEKIEELNQKNVKVGMRISMETNIMLRIQCFEMKIYYTFMVNVNAMNFR